MFFMKPFMRHALLKRVRNILYIRIIIRDFQKPLFLGRLKRRRSRGFIAPRQLLSLAKKDKRFIQSNMAVLRLNFTGILLPKKMKRPLAGYVWQHFGQVRPGELCLPLAWAMKLLFLLLMEIRINRWLWEVCTTVKINLLIYQVNQQSPRSKARQVRLRMNPYLDIMNFVSKTRKGRKKFIYMLKKILT